MAITNAIIQIRRGDEADFDPDQMRPGEWSLSTDTRYVRICVYPGVCIRMATYESFEADMEQIQAILEECKNVEQAVLRIQEEIRNDWIDVEYYANLSKSYAVGGTGIRENEDVDNAQYYKNQAERISQGLSGALLPMGTITFSQLANQTKHAGYMYNISNSFTTDNTFKEGAGYDYPAGTNVYYTADGYWDCIAGTSVVGVKGSAESSYRKGNVNITKSNIGLSNVNNTSDADKPISTATQAAFDELNERKLDKSQLVANLLATKAGDPLDATMGKVLKNEVDSLNNVFAKSNELVYLGELDASTAGNSIEIDISPYKSLYIQFSVSIDKVTQKIPVSILGNAISMSLIEPTVTTSGLNTAYVTLINVNSGSPEVYSSYANTTTWQTRMRVRFYGCYTI